jgi:hypothetical protein
LDSGLRTDGGIGEILTKISFINHPGYYMTRFFYEIGFFITVIVILLSIVFGIIIDTFAELREHSREIDDDIVNVCFICGARKDDLEKERVNFTKHVHTDHDLWNYSIYVIGLKFVDPQETNAINSYVINMLNEKSIAWFPVYKTDKSNEI